MHTVAMSMTNEEIEEIGARLREDVNATVRSGVIGSEADLTTAIEATLASMREHGAVDSSGVESVMTAHAEKSFLGRVKDFILWKTPLKKWTRNQFNLVEVYLADELERLQGRRGVWEDEEEFQRILREVSGLSYWEKEYWTNPYEIMIASIQIQPTVPISFVQSTLQLSKEDSQ